MGASDPVQAVVAGSPGFITAVLPHLSARLGVQPRAADAPHQVFALCQDGASLLVLEYAGHEWLPLAEDLKTAFGDALAMLAAVPPQQASARGALAGAGVDEVVLWDGKPQAILAALDRLLGPGTERAPAVAPGRSPPATTPPRAAPAVTPARAVPAVTPPRAAPAVTPARAAPAVTPARAAPAVAPPRAAQPVTTPPRAAPAVTPGRPTPGVTAAQPATQAAPRPLGEPPQPPPLPRARGAAPAPAPAYFADLDEPNFSVTEAPPDAPATWGDAEMVAFEPSRTWPGTLLSSSDAEGLLAGAVAGFPPQAPELKVHTDRVLAALSPLERDALAGSALPVGRAPVCRAAALRWQVSAALASAPGPGSPVDGAAVRAILAEIDAVLGVLKGSLPAAPPGSAPDIERLRRDLVSEAVDLTEAVHRIAPSGAPASPAARAPAVAATRILSARAVTAGEEAEAPGRPGAWIVLALTVALVASYHGWRRFLRARPPPLPSLPGAPAGTMLAPPLPGGVKMLLPEKPGPVDRAEMDRFHSTEELKGGTVRELGAGVIVVLPEGAATGPGDPPPR